MNDTVTHVFFLYNPLAVLPCCPLFLLPHRPGKSLHSNSFLSSLQQSTSFSHCSLPSAFPPANEYFIVSSGQKVLGSAAVRGLANDKLGFSPCRTGGVIMDRGSQSWISEIHGTCIA